ncbi:MAG: protein kinase domain-containing protein [Blastocatellia bacterium]
MDPQRWQKIDRLLDTLLDLPTQERAATLARECAGDSAMRREVEALLQAHARAGSFIESPPAQLPTQLDAALAALAPAHVTTEISRPILIGQTLGHYQLRDLLGAGGMGEVYRAFDTRLEREVAVKVLSPALAANPEAIRRFQREARAVAALSHPGILSIHDFGDDHGVSFAVMELLHGEPLRAEVARGALPWTRAVEITLEILPALEAAHARGIIHRDLKPDNIFLTREGRVKILDFGIARVKQNLHGQDPNAQPGDIPSTMTSATAPGRVIGTYGYMSPEQVRGETVDIQSDLFSLGCVLYEMITGKQPFARDTVAETMAAILRDEPAGLAPGRTGAKSAGHASGQVSGQASGQASGATLLPEPLKQILRRMLAKTPEDRYQAATQLQGDLEPLARQPASAVSSATLTGGNPARAGLATLLLVLLSVAGWFAWTRWTGRFAGAPARAIAILPLAGAEVDAQTESIGDGIVEGVINRLSQTRDLRVMARSTVFRYKGQPHDPRRIGQELGVAAVLTGSVRRQGETLVISAELVNAADGVLLWGERFERPVAQMLSLQNEIAEGISGKLALDLSEPTRARLSKRPTDNPEAWRQYLYGRYHWNKRTTEGFKKSVEYFREAIRMDPRYALAWAGLADAYFLGGSELLPPREARQATRDAAMRAIELDPDLAEARTSLAMIRMFEELNWAEAERGFLRAIELSPSYATAHHWYGILLFVLGRFEESQTHLQQARALEPFSLAINKDIGESLYHARKFAAAVAQFRRTLELDANYTDLYRWVGNALALKGDEAGAIEVIFKADEIAGRPADVMAALRAAAARDGLRGYWSERLAMLRESAKTGAVSPFSFAIMHARTGDREQSMNWLLKAEQQRLDDTGSYSGMVYLKVDPRFDLLRDDPRFRQLLQRMNLK